MKKASRLCLITWRDACSTGEAGWSTPDEIRKLDGIMISSVGWAVKESKNTVTLAASSHQNGLSGDVCIPKGCIVSTVELAPRKRKKK
jgi:hypothetical protein